MKVESNSEVAIGPWVRKSRRQVYDNPWIEITHKEVITPAGTDGIYGKVHFKRIRSIKDLSVISIHEIQSRDYPFPCYLL